MNVPSPFYPLGDHLAIDLPGACALFTTRRGGVSRGPYASLNLGRLTDDDPEAVARNRAAVEVAVGARLRYVRQVHGTTVLEASNGSEPLAQADALLSTHRGLAPTVLTADCLPIALATEGSVAMVHAGWRGLAAGIVAKAVRAVAEQGGGAPVTAAIGPGAGGCCYEIGDEVRRAFEITDTKLDLKAIARSELEDAGVAMVHDVEICTICSDPALFFSHRRDGGITGRQAGIAWLR